VNHAPPTCPSPIRGTLDDLPPAAARAIRMARALPEQGTRRTVEAGGVRCSALEWGSADGRPLLLIHGVTSSSRTFWRVGPALAALGWRTIAPDLPGHGRTGGGDGAGFRFAETAQLVAAFARAAFGGDMDGRLAVVGHSWGSMIAASLPTAGLRPARIVLLDPPVMDRATLQAMVDDPSSRPYPSYDAALAIVASENPTWPEGDQIAKAEALSQVTAEAAIAVLLGNGDWDAGLAPLTDPAAAGIPVWIVRGEDETGSLTPASWLPRLAERIGADHVLTVGDGPHSPQRTHLAATVLALLRALEG
jgi:pimeloyl-ACP methyl ester carboxylesterase